MLLSLKFNSEKENQTKIKSLLCISCCDFVCEVVCLGIQMTDKSCCLGLLNMTPVWLNASAWRLYLSIPRSPCLSFCCCHWPSVFCCRDDHGRHQRSQMKGGLYPHLCPSLLTPLSFCLSLSLWFHNPPLIWTMNRASHLFLQTIVFTIPTHFQMLVIKFCLCYLGIIIWIYIYFSLVICTQVILWVLNC